MWFVSPIRYTAHLPKTRCTIILSLILHCPSMQTLEQLVLLTLPFLILLDLLKQVWHLPLKLPFWETLLRRCSTQTLTSLSKTLPWDDPVARALDFEVHRRKMAGKFMSLPLVGWPLHSFITLFSFLFLIVILSDLDFRWKVLWPTSLGLCSRRCRLNWAARFGVQDC